MPCAVPPQTRILLGVSGGADSTAMLLGMHRVASEFKVTDKSLGTRHRAALGLSEETDAAVISVSEQSGAISVCYRGTMKHRLNEGELRSELSRIFRIRPEDEVAPPASDDVTPESPGAEGAESGGEKAAV